MILIKPFITGVLYDYFKLICAHINEGDKIRECYSCVKMIVQAHLNVDFFPIFCIKPVSLKRFYFKQKMECLGIKTFA